MGILRWCAAGDSITGPVGRWPWQALNVTSRGDAGVPAVAASCTYVSGKIVFRNMAISGTRLNTNGFPDLVQLAPVDIDPIVAVKSVASNGGSSIAPKSIWIFSNSIGSNDGALGGLGSVAAYAAANAAATVARKTAGYDIAGMTTLIARGDGVLTETNRLPYNALLNNPSWQASNGIDFVWDLASATHAAPQFLPINSGGDTTWFMSDNVHPQDALSAELGVIALAGLNTIIAANGL